MTLWTDLLQSEVFMVAGRYPTRVLTSGRGSPLILLHGQGGSLENFRHNIRSLATQHRVVALDLLWHGRSAKPEVDPTLIPTWVEQVIDVMRALQLDGCHFEGQSLGGWVAATIARTHPELVRSLVLTTPMGLDAQPGPPHPGSLAHVLNAQLAALDELTQASVRRRMEILFADPSSLDDEIVDLRLAFYSDADTNVALRHVAKAYLGGTATYPFRLGPPALAELSVPTLLYWGSANIGGAQAGEQLAAVLPGAEYHCADVGHWAQYERPDEHNRVVLDFTARHD
jgi:pimeloyl-ACP methyl ester carboxylesterase